MRVIEAVGGAVRRRVLLGVLRGEGIGPEVLAVAEQALSALPGLEVEVRHGGDVGRGASDPGVAGFVESVLADGGAILCGPAAGRFVYDLRARFDLFVKLTPIRPLRALLDAGAVRAEARRGVDVMMVRENTGGAYFGDSRLEAGVASLSVRYAEREVERVARVASQLAAARRGRLALTVKSDGVAAISRLWADVAGRVAEGVSLEVMQVDNAAFQLVQSARSFDVVLSPNMLGDILADTAGLLLGSRGMCHSGNFSPRGDAVYQTGHGAAQDLAGLDRANPCGQLLALAMALEVSFGRDDAARALVEAIEHVLADGFRTPDVAAPGARVVGTRELGRRVVERLRGAS